MKPKPTLTAWLAQARSALRQQVPQEPVSSLYVLLEKTINRQRAWLLAHPDTILNEQQLSSLDVDLRALLEGVPLAYILRYRDFYGMRFTITTDVLIPRPETELLVETALTVLSMKQYPCLIADVGTGSGCIATAIAAHHAQTRIIASDISFNSLLVASQNFQLHTLQERVFPMQTDLLAGIETRFDLICANLPYIPSPAVNDLEVSRYEPHLALDGGEDGLRIVERLLKQARSRLATHGSILLEMQYDQADRLKDLARLHFPAAEVIIKKDLANHDRLLVIHLLEGALPCSQKYCP